MKGFRGVCQAPTCHSFDEKSAPGGGGVACGSLRTKVFDDGNADGFHLGFVELASHVEASGHDQFQGHLEWGREFISFEDL